MTRKMLSICRQQPYFYNTVRSIFVVCVKNTHYDTLGIKRSANNDEIKQAYLKKCKKFHPDKHKGNKIMHLKFVEINEAYQTLTDPVRRSSYDQKLSNPFDVVNGQRHSSRSQGFDYYRFYQPPHKNTYNPSYSKNKGKQTGQNIVLLIVAVFLSIYATLMYSYYKRMQYRSEHSLSFPHTVTRHSFLRHNYHRNPKKSQNKDAQNNSLED